MILRLSRLFPRRSIYSAWTVLCINRHQPVVKPLLLTKFVLPLLTSTSFSTNLLLHRDSSSLKKKKRQRKGSSSLAIHYNFIGTIITSILLVRKLTLLCRRTMVRSFNLFNMISLQPLLWLYQRQSALCWHQILKPFILMSNRGRKLHSALSLTLARSFQLLLCKNYMSLLFMKQPLQFLTQLTVISLKRKARLINNLSSNQPV